MTPCPGSVPNPPALQVVTMGNGTTPGGGFPMIARPPWGLGPGDDLDAFRRPCYKIADLLA